MPAHPHNKPAPAIAESDSADLSAASHSALHEMEQANRLRRLQAGLPQGQHILIEGKPLLNLASNDYLALSRHPKLIEAAVDATRGLGVGAGASRLVSGTQPIHQALEQRFAAFKHAEAALLLPSGYTANLAVLTTLARPGDLILMDKLVHASLIDAARASGAAVRTFPHLDYGRGEQLLRRHPTGRRFLVTDSVFSMDGDCADLPALCGLADRYDASLIVDEAHGTGLLGHDGSGLASAQRVAERVYACGTGGVVISTASKALGGLGGLISTSQAVIDLLINKARPFIYSTAVPPAQAAAIGAAIEVVRDEPERRQRLAALAARFRDGLADRGWRVAAQEHPTPIIPLFLGQEQDALRMSRALADQGFFAPAIRPPTVTPGQSRLRLSLRADLTQDAADHLLNAVGRPRDWA